MRAEPPEFGRIPSEFMFYFDLVLYGGEYLKLIKSHYIYTALSIKQCVHLFDTGLI